MYQVRIQHHNTHGLSAEFMKSFDSVADARTELATEVKARRNTKRFFVTRDGHQKFYANEYGSAVGVFWTLAIVWVSKARQAKGMEARA
jgi:hypothetical protein